MMLLGAVSTLVIALLMAATLGMLLLTGRVWRRSRPSWPPRGPDDDPEFINALEWLVRGGDPDEEP